MPLLFLSGLVFVLLFLNGLDLAWHKPLWNDELVTQTGTIEGIAYKNMILGHLGGEGGVAPLFYLIQKGITDLTHFDPSDAFRGASWFYQEKYPQLLLRLSPILAMSLALTLIFYYFSLSVSIRVGVYALAVALSSFMVWSYWAEARGYALFFLLTTVQSLIFLHVLEQPQVSAGAWRGLSIVHWLLALTSILGMVPIIFVSVLLWMFKERRWGPYVGCMVGPLFLSLYYYVQSPKFRFWFKEGPMELMGAVIPKDRFLIIAVFMVVLLGSYWVRRGTKTILFSQDFQKFLVYGVFVFLMIASYVGLCLLLIWKECLMTEGFQISNRYFMGLAPIGIIATVMASLYLYRLASPWWGKMMVIIFLGSLLLFRMERTLQFLSVRPSWLLVFLGSS